MKTIKVGGKSYTTREIAVLEKAGVFNQIGAKHDVTGGATAQPMHGLYPGSSTQYGPFSALGARPGMWNTTPQPRSVGAVIPLRKSVYLNEIIDVLTGVIAATGTNSTNACVVGPKSGSLKTCRQSYQYGVVHMSTPVVDLTQVGQYVNRADVPREIWNMAVEENKFLPRLGGLGGMSTTASQLRANMYAFGTNLATAVDAVHIAGVDATENNTYLGVARQWAGLDAQITTGRRDPSGYLCPALDSNVVSFNASIGGTDAFGRTIVEALTDTYYASKDQARTLKIANVVWGLVIRPDHFRALAERWACLYGVYRCSDGSVGSPVARSASEIALLRDQFTQGEYLLIDGDRVPVILDDSIPRDVLANNTYKADIYGVALSADGRQLLTADYFDMGNPAAMEYQNLGGLMSGGNSQVINDGLYRVGRFETPACLNYDFYAKVRLILDAPFLSFRLDDAQYTSYFRQSDPISGMSYYRDGGVSYRTSLLP